jgi:hypothetical protein
MRTSVNASSPSPFAQSILVLVILASLGATAHAQQQLPGAVQPGPILRAERPPPFYEVSLVKLPLWG